MAFKNEFHVEGVLQSAEPRAGTTAKGKAWSLVEAKVAIMGAMIAFRVPDPQVEAVKGMVGKSVHVSGSLGVQGFKVVLESPVFTLVK